MIISTKPLSLAEVEQLLDKNEPHESVSNYLKKFSKMEIKKANEMSDELRALSNVKIKEEHIVKAVEFLPKDAEEVHKIFSDVSLDEQEVNSILGIVAKY